MNQDDIRQQPHPNITMDTQKQDSKAQVDTFEDTEDNRSKSNKEAGVFEGDLDYSGAAKKTNPLEISLVKKLDYRIMPTLWAMYFLNYLDRSAIASARLNDLEEDLGLVGSQYNTCISVLFVGYLIMQVPSNMIMNSGKIRPSIYMGLCMVSYSPRHTCPLSNNISGALGHRLGIDCHGQELYWLSSCALLPWSHRSSLLPWCTLSSLHLLHPQRDCRPNCHFVFWKHLRYVVCWSHCCSYV